jgi:uncharacterized membrane protein YdbT with pleckstrin-like domain
MPTPAPPTVDQPEETLFAGHPALVPSVGALLLTVLTVGLYLLVRLWVRLGLRYQVTTRRVVVESGVLSKRLEQVDLYRVTDYQVERPLGQRLLGTGNLVLLTVDRTNPRVVLGELKTDVLALYEAVRAATEADRARRGVRVVDYE